MKRFSLRFNNLWIAHCVGLLLIAFAAQGLGASTNVSNNMYLTVRLVKQKGHLTFEASIHNKTTTKSELAYGACAFSFKVKVDRKDYASEPAKVCAQVIIFKTAPPKGFVVVATAKLRNDLESALIKATGNYSGEFRFTMGGKTIIYTRQLR